MVIIAGFCAAFIGNGMDSADYLEQIVNKLSAGIGVRSYRDHARLDAAAEYISGQFTSFGYKVARQPFHYDGQVYHNIIAELRGKSRPDKILIVGAHYDTVRTTFGADDNASGVAGLLDLARRMAAARLAKTVRFVAFALEEPPVYRSPDMGSYHYAESLKEKGETVEGMICLEMIGYFCDTPGCQHYPLPFMGMKYPEKGDYIALVGNAKSKRFTEDIAGAFRKGTDLPVVTLNAPAIVIGIDFSDHWSFNKFGYRALMVTDTAFYRNPNYHAPGDVPDSLDYMRMAKVADGLETAIEEWGNRPWAD